VITPYIGTVSTELIPSGIYCYIKNGLCPYWDKYNTQPHQDNGYCHYLKIGDWEHDNEGWT